MPTQTETTKTMVLTVRERQERSALIEDELLKVGQLPKAFGE